MSLTRQIRRRTKRRPHTLAIRSRFALRRILREIDQRLAQRMAAERPAAREWVADRFPMLVGA
jgi:hypothetical protein